MKQAIGLNCFTKQIISLNQNINHLIPPAQVFALCLSPPSTPQRRMENDDKEFGVLGIHR